MTRSEIINRLIEKNGYKSYLEIGLDDTSNFRSINCESKESVDPYFVDASGSNGERIVCNSNGELLPHIKEVLTYRCTSDEFFDNTEKTYDIIFIDGLHSKEQVYKDIRNSLKHLNKNGIIVCHDSLPINENAQIVPRITQEWNGDVWKAILGMIDLGLDVNVVDDDYGCALIRYTDRELPESIEFLHEYRECFCSLYVRNRIMNVISVEGFIEKYL